MIQANELAIYNLDRDTRNKMMDTEALMLTRLKDIETKMTDLPA